MCQGARGGWLRVLWIAMGAWLAAGGCVDRGESSDPAEQIQAAWEDYRLGNFDWAIGRFRSALKTAKEGSDAHLNALYGLATTWNLRRPGEDTQQGEQLYGKLIALNPRHDLAAWSMLAMARMKHLAPVGQEPDYPAVRRAYEDVIDRFPFHLAGEEAFVYQQSTLVASQKESEASEAVAALEQFIQAHAKSPFISAAYALLAESLGTLGQPEKAVAARIKSVETAGANPQAPRVDNARQYWVIAVTAEFDAGDFETARRYYGLLIEQYPTDIRVFGAKQALARMGAMEAKVRSELTGRSESAREGEGG